MAEERSDNPTPQDILPEGIVRPPGSLFNSGIVISQSQREFLRRWLVKVIAETTVQKLKEQADGQA